MTWDTLDSQSLRISWVSAREREGESETEWESGEIKAERRGKK